jgi:hypothetical protein
LINIWKRHPGPRMFLIKGRAARVLDKMK